MLEFPTLRWNSPAILSILRGFVQLHLFLGIKTGWNFIDIKMSAWLRAVSCTKHSLASIWHWKGFPLGILGFFPQSLANNSPTTNLEQPKSFPKKKT